MKTNPWFRLSATLTLVVAIVASCSTGAPQQTELMKSFAIEDFTSRELTVVVLGFGAHYAGIVELAAQAIQDSADSQRYGKTPFCGR